MTRDRRRRAHPVPSARASAPASARPSLEVLDSGWLTTGPRTAEFEAAFAAFVGSRPRGRRQQRHGGPAPGARGRSASATATRSSCPTYTFAASAEVVLYQRARPVLVDVDPVDRSTSTPAAVGAAIERRGRRAIEVVHSAGLPATWPDVAGGGRRRAGRRGRRARLPVADRGARWPVRGDDRAGRRLQLLCHQDHHDRRGRDARHRRRRRSRIAARTMRLHGIGRDAWKRYTAAGSWYYEIEAAGLQGQPDRPRRRPRARPAPAGGRAARGRARGIAAALPRAGSRTWPRTGRLILPATGSGDEHAWHLFIVRLGDGGAAGDAIDLELPGVADPAAGAPAARPRAAPAPSTRCARRASARASTSSRSTSTRSTAGWATGPGEFPAAEAAYAGAISLPIWPGMTDASLTGSRPVSRRPSLDRRSARSGAAARLDGHRPRRALCPRAGRHHVVPRPARRHGSSSGPDARLPRAIGIVAGRAPARAVPLAGRRSRAPSSSPRSIVSPRLSASVRRRRSRRSRCSSSARRATSPSAPSPGTSRSAHVSAGSSWSRRSSS